jgi:hypothetical protein
MIYTAGMEIPVCRKRTAAQNPLGDLVIDPVSLAEAELQRQEHEARIRARNPLPSDEEISEEVGEQIFECLSRQRRYLQGALRIAERIVQAQGFFPNHNDYLTNVEIAYVGMAAMALCSVTDPYGSQLANDVEGLAKRCVEAESGSSSKDQLIENLQDRVDDLERLNREGGSGRGNKS